MEEKVKRVKISILNNEYIIKTDAEESHLLEIASYIEEKINEISKGDISMVIPQPFLLATLKIADEYFRLKREFEEYRDRAEQKSKQLVELLDNSLLIYEGQDKGRQPWEPVVSKRE